MPARRSKRKPDDEQEVRQPPTKAPCAPGRSRKPRRVAQKKSEPAAVGTDRPRNDPPVEPGGAATDAAKEHTDPKADLEATLLEVERLLDVMNQNTNVARGKILGIINDAVEQDAKDATELLPTLCELPETRLRTPECGESAALRMCRLFLLNAENDQVLQAEDIAVSANAKPLANIQNRLQQVEAWLSLEQVDMCNVQLARRQSDDGMCALTASDATHKLLKAHGNVKQAGPSAVLLKEKSVFVTFLRSGMQILVLYIDPGGAAWKQFGRYEQALHYTTNVFVANNCFAPAAVLYKKREHNARRRRVDITQTFDAPRTRETKEVYTTPSVMKFS